MHFARSNQIFHLSFKHTLLPFDAKNRKRDTCTHTQTHTQYPQTYPHTNTYSIKTNTSTESESPFTRLIYSYYIILLGWRKIFTSTLHQNWNAAPDDGATICRSERLPSAKFGRTDFGKRPNGDAASSRILASYAYLNCWQSRVCKWFYGLQELVKTRVVCICMQKILGDL